MNRASLIRFSFSLTTGTIVKLIINKNESEMKIVCIAVPGLSTCLARGKSPIFRLGIIRLVLDLN